MLFESLRLQVMILGTFSFDSPKSSSIPMTISQIRDWIPHLLPLSWHLADIADSGSPGANENREWGTEWTS
jgi:hypothetical protein